LDLSDVGTPRLSWRRFRNIMGRLPRTSETSREIHGEVVDWGITETLLNALLYVTQAAHYGGKGPKPEMIPIPRSRVARAIAPRVSRERMKHELAKWRAGEVPNFN